MAYKDKNKQKEAQRKRVRQKRVLQRGSTEGLVSIPERNIPGPMTITPEGLKLEVPKNYGQPDCECYHCRQNKTNGSRHKLNHGAHKPADQLAPNEVNRVSLPGDVDYKGVCLQDKYKDRRIVRSTADLTLQSDKNLIAKQRKNDQYIRDNPEQTINFGPQPAQHSQTQPSSVLAGRSS